MAQSEEKLRKQNVLVTVPNSILPQFPPPVKPGWSQSATKHHKHELISGHSFSDEENHDF